MDKPVYIIVTPFFPSPTDWSGSYCYDFAKTLEDTGAYRVLIFREGNGGDYEFGGFEVYTFRVRRLPSNVFPFLSNNYNQRSFVEKVVSVGKKQGWGMADVVVCHGHTANFGIYPLALKRFGSNCKTLLHHHDPQSFGLNTGALVHCWPYNLIQFLLLRRLHEQIDCHVFISEVVKRSFLNAPNTDWTKYDAYKKQMWGLPWRPVRIKQSIILHNGVNKNVFCPSQKAQYYRSVDKTARRILPFTVGCVGHFLDWKDQETLIRAIARLKEENPDMRIRAIFIGTGVLLNYCKGLARDLGVEAEFRTEVVHEKLAEFYRGLNLFVLPSYFEGFGCVFTEVHSCGVPFITCEGQGIEDVVAPEERHLWLCRQRDPEDLAKKIMAYYTKLPVQRLTEDQDICVLVHRFVEQIKERLNG